MQIITAPVATPIAWTIAGSDSGAGAGVQADTKTMQSFSVYCCSVITAVTAQNTGGVLGVEPISTDMVQLQIRALKDDLKPSCIKIGMLHSLEIVEAVVSELRTLETTVVYDPVMFATSGDALIQNSALQAIRSNLLSRTTLLTPNWAEAHYLVGREIVSASNFDQVELADYIEELASNLLQFGSQSILLKGGHVGGEFSQDFWTDGDSRVWLTSRRQESRQTHGTGCTLSAAIAAGLAQGHDIVDSIVIAKAYVNRGIRLAPHVGSENGPLAHLDLDFQQNDLPWVTETAIEATARKSFKRDDSVGFYPVVPSLEWVSRLAKAGVKTMQLRIKHRQGDQLEREVAQAIETAKVYGCNLYVNDYWALAIKFGAFGVHLGQEDLLNADIGTISGAGLRLGVSTHCYEEVARAIALQPSYIAIGPIYPTTTKQMRFAPQGRAGFERWRKSLNFPLVAIGGITLEGAEELLKLGADGIAVVRDVIDHGAPEMRVRQWLQLWTKDV
ncbi:bifunctional hydroxymethylpyrimidine kinase/phosphomethylpyrimidine kinase [soil metagenome]